MKDTFRKEYKPLSGETKDTMFVFKSVAENLEKEFDLAQKTLDADKRCIDLARAKLEEAVMWSIKSIT